MTVLALTVRAPMVALTKAAVSAEVMLVMVAITAMAVTKAMAVLKAMETMTTTKAMVA